MPQLASWVKGSFPNPLAGLSGGMEREEERGQGKRRGERGRGDERRGGRKVGVKERRGWVCFDI